MSSPTKKNHTTIIGNSVDINIDPYSCESEIHTDVVVLELVSIRLWGQVVNCDGEPVPNALVKLVKIVVSDCGKRYEGIAHTTSDCQGFYQFDIYSDEHAWYKILVGKANTGKEIIVSSSSKNHPTYDPDSSLYDYEPDPSSYDYAPSSYSNDDYLGDSYIPKRCSKPNDSKYI